MEALLQLAPERLAVLAAGGGLIAGFVLAWLLALRGARQREALLRADAEKERALLAQRQEQAERDQVRLRAELEEREREQEHLNGRLEETLAREARLEMAVQERDRRIEELREELARRGERLEALERERAALRAEQAELRTRLEEQQRAAEEKLAELEKAREALRLEFENLANRIFEEQGKALSERSRKGLDEILAPVRDQLRDFRKRIDEIHAREEKGRGMLEQHLRQLQDLNRQLNEEARNLARALKGDRKVQGTWGEIVLERVLEQSGLRKGIEYEVQGSFRDGEGRLLRPDVIIHLPEGKDIIVDSKVSLGDYEQYVNATDDLEARAALKRHLQAVRDHIDRLSGKHYEDLEGVNSLDFVLMFMPIESAFTTAFQEDPELFSRAFEQRIIVVTPTTLLATLRTIENMWRFERQNENTRRIAERAGRLYDKLRGFLEDFEKIGQQLDTARGTWEKARGKLVQGRGNLVRQAEAFVALGVKVKREIPRALREEAGATDLAETIEEEA